MALLAGLDLLSGWGGVANNCSPRFYKGWNYEGKNLETYCFSLWGLFSRCSG